ncbi:hypothetical protein DMB38_25825 [Streptomyces sp. WAC 06738]|uniref:heparinase II/III domain-containing protein n=1 Tax=Streptomyces sp. WAC 06738 TaxID=2203210 RepID=UPI000F709305|nr:heparinase II/III family protein [Streptomyces sp. WAC 06738]AZM48744.1 hypothetical protein DMB38_25825 [Streptomyces sp. WAC 06738]
MKHRSLAELTRLLEQSPPVAPFHLENVRKNARQPYAATLMEAIQQEAARGVAEGPMPQLPWSLQRLYDETGDRTGYERHRFARRRRLVALAMSALVDGGPERGRREVLEALAGMLWSVCDEYTWSVPAHATYAQAHGRTLETCVDPFSCETAHTLAEVVFLLAGRLPAPVVERVRANVSRRVLDPLYADPRPWPWESARTAWAAVCGGAAGMAALLLEDDPALLAAGIDRSLRALDTFLSGLAADGGCAAGIGHWAYGFDYFTHFTEALRARTGIDLFAERPLACLAAEFPAAVALGADRYPSFAGSPGSHALSPGLLTRLHERCGVRLPPITAIPEFGSDHCHLWALTRDLAWTDPAVLNSAPSMGTTWLPELGWLTDRRLAADGLAVAFAAKGGHNGEPYNHNDLGQFILSAGGEQLLADIGPGEYATGFLDPHHSAARLHPSAEAHSVPVVDGHPQRAGRNAAARVVEQRTTGQSAYLELDLSSAYEGGAEIRRRFEWRADGHLTLTDFFTGAKRAREVFMSRLRPELDTGVARWRGTYGVAELRYRHRCWRPAVEELEVTDHLGRPGTVYRLRLDTRGAVPKRAVFELVLARNRAATSSVRDG